MHKIKCDTEGWWNNWFDVERLILWKPAKGNLLARVDLVYIDIILTDIKAAAGWGCSQNSTE